MRFTRALENWLHSWALSSQIVMQKKREAQAFVNLVRMARFPNDNYLLSNDRHSKGIHGISAIVSALEMKFHASPETNFRCLWKFIKETKVFFFVLHNIWSTWCRIWNTCSNSFLSKTTNFFNIRARRTLWCMLEDASWLCIKRSCQVENLFKTHCLCSVITEEKVWENFEQVAKMLSHLTAMIPGIPWRRYIKR